MADHTSNTQETLEPTPNRRRLLVGADTTALAASAALINPAAVLAGGTPASASVPDLVPIAVADDPACRAFEVVRAARDAADAHRGPEEEYERIFDHYMAAEEALAATPSRSLMGLYGKIKWLAKDQGWESGNCFYGSEVGLSVLRDIERMTGHTLNAGGRP